MINGRLRVAVIGAGNWAIEAHIPGWQRDPRCEVVALCDIDGARAREVAQRFGIAHATTEADEVIARADVDVVDVCTGDRGHFPLTMAALAAGKHVLCEKPVNHDHRETRRAAALARAKGLKTKLGFTFRYSPAMQYMKELIDQGFVGQPYIFNGFEQNSQWLRPETPLRQVTVRDDESEIQVSSLEGYGAPIIDLAHWFMGQDLRRVVGTMRNFVPERVVRETGRLTRVNIDDGDIFIGEFADGALCSVQSSFVTVGNYPGLEARVYGSEGALICRLVEENGICETLKGAKPDAVEFRDIPVPERLYPPQGSSREPWPRLFYSNLTRDFATEILSGGDTNQGDFGDGAWVQEVINAVERSFRERRWVDLPLDDDTHG
jgi:predicted dehydrogenase